MQRREPSTSTACRPPHRPRNRSHPLGPRDPRSQPPIFGSPPPGRKVELPPWGTPLLAAIVPVAVLADLAARVPFASVATTLLVIGLAGLLVVAGRTSSLAQRLGLVLLVASGTVLTVRTSDWVSVVLALSVGALVALVATDGLVLGQRRPWSRSFFAWLTATFDVWPWLQRGLHQVGQIGSGRLAVWLRSAGIASGVVFVLGLLLASGDAAFGWLVSIFDVAAWLGHLVVIALMIIPASIVALVAARSRPEFLESAAIGAPSTSSTASSGRSYRPEALAAMWAVAATLLVWCGLQVALISGGARSVVLSERGLTAAEYARQGFFQLVAVAAISLAVLNSAHRVGRRNLTPDPGQRVPAGLIGLTLGALIVVSFSRLAYYIGSFGLTMLRLSVATFLAWLAVMTAASVARSFGLHHQRNWLPSAAVLSAAVFAVGFGVANPERWVAQVNLDRATVDEPVDAYYLVVELGPDAAPTVAEYRWARLGGRPDLVTDELCAAAVADDGSSPLGWNLSRSYRPPFDCPGPDLPTISQP